MSVWVQVLLGFVPVWVIGAVVVAVTRGKKPQWIAALVLLAAVGGAAVWAVQTGAVDTAVFEPTQRESGSKDIPAASSNGFLAAAYSLMEQGYHDAANRTLDEYLEYHPYSAEYALAKARMSVLCGDVAAANGLYGVAHVMSGGGPSREEEAVRTALHGKQSFVLWQEAAGLVSDAIGGLAQEVDRRAADAVAEAMEINTAFEDFTHLPEEERAELVREAERWVNRLDPEYTSIPEICDAVTKARVMNGDYGDIIESLDEVEDVDSLLIAAELIRNGLVTEDDVSRSGDFLESQENTDAVERWIEEQLDRSQFSDEEQEIIDRILEELKDPAGMSSAAFRWIEQRILRYIAGHDDRENAKLYLELARLCLETGRRERAAAYLELALGEMGNSKDPDFAGAASAILDIIRNPEDTESRKNIAEHVENLTDSMLPDGVEEIMEQRRDELAAAGEGPGHGDPGAESTDRPGFGGLWPGFPGGSGQNTPEPTAPGTGTPGTGTPGGNLEGTGGTTESFEQYITDTINQKTGSVSIVSVDASGFDTVVAIAAVDESIADSAAEFKKNLRVLDCSIEIDDFEVEKLTYRKINIILVCDNSGSMSGSKIDNLKKALDTFTDISGEVNMAIVPFSSGVISDKVRPFGSTQTELREGVEAMTASGGTSIYSAVNYALEMFPEDRDALNVLILMSDGQDSAPSNSATLNMTAACQAKSAAIYSMGLGSDADSNVLNAYARIGGGSYMYVSDSDSLLSFYEYIYALCMNRYRITYTAADTVKASRTMELEGINTVTAYDDYTYYLYEDAVSEGDLGDDYQVVSGKVVLKGLENRLFYRSSIAQTTNLLGSGFEEDDAVTIELHGGVKYILETEFVDSTHIKVTVPSNVACGVYDVYVTYAGRRSVFKSGFVMTSNDRHIIRFGDYVFTATELSSSGNATILGGVVNMNEWLGFTGDVTITGDVEKDASVILSYSGAYVQYADNGTSTGLAKYLAQNGYTLPVPGVPSMRLYNDPSTPSSGDDYPVDKVYLRGMYVRIVDFIGFNGPGLSLYPDRMVIDFQAFDTKFPFQDALMKAFGTDDLFSFKLDHTEKIILTSGQVGMDLSVELGQNSRNKYSGKLGNLNVYYKDASLKLDVNTIDGDIAIKVMTDVAFLTNGLGVELAWKDWKFDAAKLYANKEFDTFIGNVPVTFSDFSLGISDLSKNDNYSLGSILTSTWTGSFDCSMVKLTAVFPVMKDVVDAGFLEDAAVASLDDTTITFRPKDFYISVATNAKLLGLVDVGKCSLELGSGISYTNLLLGMNDEAVTGILGRLTVGPDIHTNNLDVTVQGTAVVALTDRVLGMQLTGDLDVEISLWVFAKDYFAKGELFLGVYRRHSGDWQFAIYAASLTSDGGSMNPVCWPSNALSYSRL